MKKTHSLAPFFITLFISPFMFAAERYDQTVLTDYLDAQKALNNSIQAMCQNNAESISVVDWQNTAINWYRVDALQLPATEFVQTDHTVVFWPDDKDGLKNQVTALIQQSPDDFEWSDLPASIKSLSAIEFMITEGNAAANCNWLLPISEHQLAQADQLANLQSFYGFDVFEQVTALHASALFAHDQLKAISVREDRIIWQLGPAWRTESGWSIQYALNQQITALLALFEGKQTSISDWQKQLTEFDLSTTVPNQDTLRQYSEFLVSLAGFVENTLAPELDIYLGFNNFDGD